jgi:hypothetical protein
MLEHYAPKDGQDLEIPMLMKGGMPGTLIDRCRKRAADNGDEERVVALTEKDVLLHRIMMHGLPVICGYDAVGWEVSRTLNKAGILVWAFTDRDEAKHGVGFDSIPIIPMSDVPKDALCIVAAMSIADVVDELERHDLHTWIPADILLSDIDCTQDNPNFEIDDTKWKIESVRIAHAAYRKPDYVFIRSLDVMITERCSLKCRDCSNLMQYFERPQDFDIEEVIADVQRVLDNVDEILEARVLGGDAFMHKQWYRMVAWLSGQEKIRRVVVYTNGKIIPQDLSALKHPKVSVFMTDYDKLLRAAGKRRLLPYIMMGNEIWHKVVIPDVWIDCATISKHNRTQEENDDLFQRCVATNLLTLADGKLFRCPFAASAWLLGATEDGGRVNVRRQEDLRGRIKKYIKMECHMPACDYCTGRILTNTIEPAVQTKKALPYKKSGQTYMVVTKVGDNYFEVENVTKEDKNEVQN